MKESMISIIDDDSLVREAVGTPNGPLGTCDCRTADINPSTTRAPPNAVSGPAVTSSAGNTPAVVYDN